MKAVSFYIFITIGILLLVYAFVHDKILAKQELFVQVQTQIDSGTSDFFYNVIIKNNHSASIRLCGSRMDWCGSGGCYRVTTSLPVTLEPKQEVTIVVSISPRAGELSETEFILYADGEGLGGLTPVRIKLPAMSLKSP
jgi:hypothetical protein